MTPEAEKELKRSEEETFRLFLGRSKRAESNIYIGEDRKVLALNIHYAYDQHWVSGAMIDEIQEVCGKAIGTIIARELSKISGSGDGKKN